MMTLEEKHILDLLNRLATDDAEVLFVTLDKAMLVLDGAGQNGPKARGCFEVELEMEPEGMGVVSITVHGVTPFKPGYVKLDGRHDPDNGNLFYLVAIGWEDWHPAVCRALHDSACLIEQYQMEADYFMSTIRRPAL